MNKQIWLVSGATGEYSDHCEWYVAAYTNEADAQAHVLLANSRAKEIYAASQRHQYGVDNEYDPHMSMDYTGTNYSVDAVPLHEALPFVTTRTGEPK